MNCGAKEEPILLEFFKIEAQGNSFVYFDLRNQRSTDIDYTHLAQIVSDVNYGIGSDGIVLIFNDKEADVYIRIFNPDGSESDLCGSAITSISALLAKKQNYEKNIFSIKTKAGFAKGKLVFKNDKCFVITEVGNIILPNHKIDNPQIGEIINESNWYGIPVHIGNPHYVMFECDQQNKRDLFCLSVIEIVGPVIGKSNHFPDGVNVELVKILSRNKVQARVWERGVGETLACGSGALAIVLAGMKYGYLDGNVEVAFPGGSKLIDINLENNRYTLSSNVSFICYGKYHYNKGSN